jgi:hypothetical protein
MKRAMLLALLLAVFFEASSQKTTIRFEGLNEPIKIYAVDIEGRQFHPAAAKQTSRSGIRVYEINYLATGTHDLLVYAINTNTLEGNRSQAIYRNSFQLKDDYEMVITVGRNGEIAFSEKPAKNDAEMENEMPGLRRPISLQRFNMLYDAMKRQDVAANRYAILNNALDVPTNYFTIFQLNTLLSLINSESERVLLAKKSSSHLLEEANAAALLEGFLLPTSKEELMKHFQIKN